MSKEELILSGRNVKPTSVRILVLRFLLQHEKAVSLKSLEEHYSYSDKSTLFRTLKTFEKQGIVHSIADGSGMKKYALCLESCECTLEDQHFHFFCNKCEETYCLNSQSVPSINLPVNFKLTEANLVLKGVCANCN
jgi:Fur family ferric uptake transcriptional regulator